MGIYKEKLLVNETYWMNKKTLEWLFDRREQGEINIGRSIDVYLYAKRRNKTVLPLEEEYARYYERFGIKNNIGTHTDELKDLFSFRYLGLIDGTIPHPYMINVEYV